MHVSGGKQDVLHGQGVLVVTVADLTVDVLLVGSTVDETLSLEHALEKPFAANGNLRTSWV